MRRLESLVRPLVAGCAAIAALVAGGCAGVTTGADGDVAAMLQRSFRPQGQAGIERLAQDELQKACSAMPAPSDERLRELADAQLASVRQPSDGRYLGDWKNGEALAQNGRGMTWSDPPGLPAGGNCYNCHELSKAEISFGTLGPSLYHYAAKHKVTDPAGPGAAEVVRYTWSKLYNAKAFNACSIMPRFGHAGVLSEAQLRDLTALLLDPRSPVNQ